MGRCDGLRSGVLERSAGTIGWLPTATVVLVILACGRGRLEGLEAIAELDDACRSLLPEGIALAKQTLAI